MLHQFAAGFLPDAPAQVVARLHTLARTGTAGAGDGPVDVIDLTAATDVNDVIDVTEVTEVTVVTEGFVPRSDPVHPAGTELDSELGNSLLPPLDEAPDLAEASRFAPTGLSSLTSMSAFLPLPAADDGNLRAVTDDADADLDAVDAVDADLFPIFDEEALELLPQLQSRLQQWHEHPNDRGSADACMRTLHTFKGGARLAGAMRLGELAHLLETEIERLSAGDRISAVHIEPMMARCDRMVHTLERLRAEMAGVPFDESAIERAVVASGAAGAPMPMPEPTWAADTHPQAALGTAAPTAADASKGEAPGRAATPTPQPAWPPAEVAPAAAAAATGAAPKRAVLAAAAGASASAGTGIHWQRFAQLASTSGLLATDSLAAATAQQTGAVRVRAALLDRLVSHAGEVSITRERMAVEMRTLQTALSEMTDSLERMRRQLRDIEVQAEMQINSRIEGARTTGQNFDPLEMDRYTRFQELTRFMAESVNDVATTQRTLQRTLQATEDELAAQGRLTRELQDDLLRTRMTEFESLADRLYRIARQAAKETGKQVRLEIIGGSIEIDRGVLERMTGPFEHLLRNSVVHGIETPADRADLGKDATGRIVVQVSQAGNEVAVDIADDGAGFDYPRIRQRAIERGLLAPTAEVDEAGLAQFLFHPGFSTASSLSELAGRGVGLDVVRAEVNAMGGRIETASALGQGTRFRLLLPLTTAVTQVVNLRCADLEIAVPSTLVEVVRRVPQADTLAAYAGGEFVLDEERMPFFWLPALLQVGTRGDASARAQTVVIIRSASQRVAIHVDEVLGNQEVVVKHVGAQLSRLPGLVGVTLLPSGSVALIYNPVALAAIYAGDAYRAMQQAQALAWPTGSGVAAGGAAGGATAVRRSPDLAPMVMVVDDSLTVRRVTQRLLTREGYRVVLAKDGLDALEKLAEEKPLVLLSDIEMPRMDGFDLVRNVRSDERLNDIPVVMITSRIAQKHRDYALELGVDHYLGKPYSDEELLSLIASYAQREATV